MVRALTRGRWLWLALSVSTACGGELSAPRTDSSGGASNGGNGAFGGSASGGSTAGASGAGASAGSTGSGGSAGASGAGHGGAAGTDAIGGAAGSASEAGSAGTSGTDASGGASGASNDGGASGSVAGSGAEGGSSNDGGSSAGASGAGTGASGGVAGAAGSGSDAGGADGGDSGASGSPGGANGGDSGTGGDAGSAGGANGGDSGAGGDAGSTGGADGGDSGTGGDAGSASGANGGDGGASGSASVGGSAGTSGSAGSAGAGGSGDPVSGDYAACNVGLSEVALYQATKVTLMRDMALVPLEQRATDVIQAHAGWLRVFVQPTAAWTPRNLRVRLTLGERQFEKTQWVAGASTDSVVASTFNFEIPAALLNPATRYAVELLEDQPCRGRVRDVRFPESERVALHAKLTGPLEVVLVPMAYGTDATYRLPDTSAEQIARYAKLVAAFFPASEVRITLREPVVTLVDLSQGGANFGDVLSQLSQLKLSDAPEPDVYYYGLVQPAEIFKDYCPTMCVTGTGWVATGSLEAMGRSAVGLGFTGSSSAETLAHELGHNHGLYHAPCGNPSSPDPAFPHAGASLGVWGYNAESGQLFPPDGKRKDWMSYCDPTWVSAYHYQKLVERVASVNADAARTALNQLRSVNVQRSPLLPRDATTQRWSTLWIDAHGKARPGPSVEASQVPGQLTAARAAGAQPLELKNSLGGVWRWLPQTLPNPGATR